MNDREKDRLERLRKIPLFTGLDDAALAKVGACATSFEVERGHVLVQRDQAGVGLFVIEEGQVTVELPGRKIELGPGEFFGELALLSDDATHVARVAAASKLQCLAIRRDTFEELLLDEPAIAVTMLRVVAKRLADSSNRAGGGRYPSAP